MAHLTGKSFSPLIILLKRLGIVIFSYFMLRILFYVFNYEIFGKLKFAEAMSIIQGGFRFDIAAIVYYNLLFIVLSVVTFPAWYKKWYQAVLAALFFATNSFAYLLAVSDLVFFRFNNKRIAADILGLNDAFIKQLPGFLVDFWYLFIIFIVLLATNIGLYKKVHITIKTPPKYYMQGIVFILTMGLSVLAARGGLQTIPITPIKAVAYADVHKTPLVTNSPYTFIYTLTEPGISEKKYFPAPQLLAQFTINHPGSKQTYTKKENVVIIVMESFSKEFIGSPNGYPGYTPFLDSLIGESLFFTNAYANAERSAKAMINIFSGFPNLMVKDFMRTRYQDNCFEGLGSYLKKTGYQTAFFHGGLNGEFEIDKFTQAAGFDKYYGRNEFNNELFFDGNWGVYDDEFFQFTVNELSLLREPFCIGLFSISSHHPFNVPEKYKGKFPKGDLDICESIGYADYSLKRFFESASKQKWYNNTLFIITADHTASGQKKHLNPHYANNVGTYSIPLLFFNPGKIKPATDSSVVQQIDIFPSIMEYLGYRENYICFGQSVFSKDSPRYAFQNVNGLYQIIDKDYIYFFNGNQGVGLYAYKADPFLKNNLFQKTTKAEGMENYLKAVVQTFNACIIHNRLCTGITE